MKDYRLADRLTQGYLLLVGGLVLLGHNATVPHWEILVTLHALVLMLIHGLIVSGSGETAPRMLRLGRDFYPIPLYLALYRETAVLNRLILPAYLDPYFIRLEDQLFGCQPSLVAMDRLPSVWLSELMHAAYLSYYLMIAGVAVLLWRKGPKPFHHFMTVTSFSLYACYLLFITLPIVGPPVFGAEVLPSGTLRELLHGQRVPPIPAAVEAGPLFQVTRALFGAFEGPGGSFPSSHVALAIVTAWFSWRHLPRLRWLHLALVPWLSAATVYGRYHYLVDVFAGMVTGALLLAAGNWLHHRFEHTETQPTARS